MIQFSLLNEVLFKCYISILYLFMHQVAGRNTTCYYVVGSSSDWNVNVLIIQSVVYFIYIWWFLLLIHQSPDGYIPFFGDAKLKVIYL